jgi:hypothetical protein
MTDATCIKSMKSPRCVICVGMLSDRCASELGVHFSDHLWRNRSLADGAAKCADFSRSTQESSTPMRSSLVAAFDKAWETDQASGVRYPATKAEQVRAMLETHYCGRNERRAQTGMCCSLRFSSRPASAGAGLPGLILAGRVVFSRGGDGGRKVA